MYHSRATDKSGYLVKIIQQKKKNKKKIRALGIHSNRLTSAAQLSTINTYSHPSPKTKQNTCHGYSLESPHQGHQTPNPIQSYANLKLTLYIYMYIK